MTLLIEQSDGIARLTLNRPERLNALNLAMGQALMRALDRADQDDSARVVILTGAGRAFCAGDDLRGMVEPGEPYPTRPDPIDQYVRGDGRWPAIVARIRSMGKPVLVAINGHAHGAGFNLALAGDLRIMADDATMAVPFVKRGLATGTSLLQQFVGIGKAMEWALLAPQLSAREAERWGLVNRVVSAADLNASTDELARELAGGPTRIYGYTKAAVYRGWEEASPERAYEHQALALHLARQTDDFKEGRRAFLDKRAPNFQGH